MANTIRIKKRASTGAAGAPSSLAPSEIAFNENTGDKKLYYGYGDNVDGTASSIIAIGGEGAFTTLDTTQTISGNKTFSGTVALGSSATAATPSENDNSTKVATTAYVQTEIANFSTGTVTSVGLSLPNIFSVSGSPVTTSGTLTGSLASQTANRVFAAPNGSNGTPSFRALVSGDIPDLSSSYLPISGGTISSNLTITGNLTVNGTQTIVNSTTVQVDDKNIELGTVASPTDTTADGGGITLKGATDKTFNWVNSTDSWTSSEHVDLGSGKEFKIAGTSVLSGSTLGSGVTGSSLTSVGTLTSGTWSASTIAVNKGGTGQTSFTDGQILIGNSTGNTLTKATLTAGANVTITNGGGSITIAATDTNTTYTAGDGLDLTGTTFSADLKANGGIVVETGELAVDLGASSITGTLSIADGGTGATTAAGARTALGAQAADADLTTLSGMQTGAATALAALTATELGILDGATVTTAELNILDGVTSTTAELNILDGVTATATELNRLDGITSTTAELNIVDGNTSATATTLATADRMVINDAGTMVQVALSDLVTFLENGAVSGFNIDGGVF